MLLRKCITDGLCLLDVEAQSLESIVRQALDHLVARGRLSAQQRDGVEADLLARESGASTALGFGVRVPHAYVDVIDGPLVVLVRPAKPLPAADETSEPTRFVFLLLSRTGQTEEHVNSLFQIARRVQDPLFLEALESAESCEELLAALDESEREPAPAAAPPADDGLVATGRFAGGLIADLKRRLPHYLSDFWDGLHAKCLSSALFLYFACLAPAVTFGGFMAIATDGQIGAVEMLVATAVCGVLYALFSGQPLIILGGTGPLLVFTGVLYQLCATWGVAEHFLAVYAWTGFWTAAFLLLLAVCDASYLMRFFTRFTDEIFAALISLIFIYESLHAIWKVFEDAYHVETVNHDTALLTLLLALGTYAIALNLSRFRSSPYLRAGVREFLADFGPTIAMAAMTLVALWLQSAVQFVPLRVPETFTTTSGRAWLVNPFSAPTWLWFAAAGPALLATVLVFLDQNITARLINSPKNKLRKGAAYHLDLAVVGILIGLSSLFGLPWLVAATVRSLNHLRSLATFQEARGGSEQKDKIVSVRETRLTGLAIHLLIGASLLLLPLLRTIPMAALYGLFLYMGVVSIKGNQFFERLTLWFMDPARYPRTHYLRRVPLTTVNLFTALQLVGLVVLWGVKVSALAILFPLFIALGVPLRMLADRFFEPEHLAALDAEEEPEEDETQWR